MECAPTSAKAAAAVDPWQEAYKRFETPEEEIRKFLRRLGKLGAAKWPRDAQIVELFCGRGNGLHALDRLGFKNLEGVDLSAELLGLYTGSAKCYVCDCRKLPFENRSRDILIAQGGLHHLPTLPESLEQTFCEMARVLRPGGRVVFVEPWLTPFLKFVHFACDQRLARRLSNKIDAIATMNEHEWPTYSQWLGSPEMIPALARKYFSPLRESFAWGKWNFVGAPR
jgi:SAM-dependent methyltransferase